MVGVIGLSTANVLERVRVAHDLGFREFQFSLPSWSVLADAEVLGYLRDVCGAFPDSLFMLYNTTKVGRVVTGPLLREAAAALVEPRGHQDDERRPQRGRKRRPGGTRADALPA